MLQNYFIPETSVSPKTEHQRESGGFRNWIRNRQSGIARKPQRTGWRVRNGLCARIGLRTGWQRFCLFTVLMLAILTKPASVKSDEPFEMFLEALRQNGHFDVAEHYLSKMETDNWISPELKLEIPFRRAQVLFEKTRTLSDIKEAIETWNSAVELAELQVTNAPQLERKLEAISMITQIKLSLAEYYRRQSELPLARIWEKPELAQVVRSELESAAVAYAKASELLLEELREARRSKDAKRRAAFPENTVRFLSNLLSELSALEKVASTFSKTDPEFKTRIADLAARNAEYRSKYKKPAPFDMYFQLNQVKCLILLDKFKEAGPLLDDILLLESPSYRLLKRDAILTGMEIWFHQEPFDIERAILQIDKVAEIFVASDFENEVVQQVLIAHAKAHRARVEHFSSIEKPTPQQRTEANTSTRLSGSILRPIAKLNSLQGLEAKELMDSWGVRGVGSTVQNVATFLEARQAGFESLSSAGELQVQYSGMAADPSQSAEANVLKQELTGLVDDALGWFERAFELADAQTLRKDVNLARLYQCQCYYMKERYLETALIGEFLLDRFPTEYGTPEAAVLAAQALNQMVFIGKRNGTDLTFEQNHMKDICQEVLKRWPERKEAGDAAYLLVAVAIDQMKLDEAEAAINKLSPTNVKRPAAELRVGLSYVREAETLERDPNPQADFSSQIATQKQNGFRLLNAALTAETEEISQLHFYGAAALAQMYNDQGKFKEAIDLLENSATSGLKRVEQNDPLVNEPTIQSSLIQSGLIAHLGLLSQGGDIQTEIARGSALLQLLSEKISQTPNKDQILIGFYGLTLKKLKEQSANAESEQQRIPLAKAMLTIFEPILEQANDWKLMYSIGDATLNMADNLPSENKEIRVQLNSLAGRCFDKALASSVNSTEPNIDAYRSQLQLSSASSLRGQAKYEAASKRLSQLLTQSPKNPQIQIELCRLYQEWGESTKDKSHIRTAIAGGLPSAGTAGQAQTNLMWGWQKLAQATISDTKNRDTFYLALFGLTSSRLSYGQVTGDAKYTQAALKAIKNQLEKDAQMGGPKWSSQFDSLAKRIQTQLKEAPNGLAGLK